MSSSTVLSPSSIPAHDQPVSGDVTQPLARRLQQARLLAVVTLEQADDAAPLAAALREGGITAVELTLRTPQALEAIRAWRQAEPEFLLGAGTVLTPGQADQARMAGADFALAPGFDRATVVHCLEQPFPFIPGVATSSEIQAAVALGCRLLKFFPAEMLGGLRGLRTLGAPFAHLGVRYVAMGGITAGQLAGYAAEDFVSAVGSSGIAPPEDIRRKAWQAITRRAHEAVIGLAARGSCELMA